MYTYTNLKSNSNLAGHTWYVSHAWSKDHAIHAVSCLEGKYSG